MSDAATTPTTTTGTPAVPTAAPAAAPAPAAAAPTTAPAAPAAPATGGLDATERAELERLREVHKDEQKWRREATEKHAPAEAYTKLLQALGVDPAKPEAKDFDAKSAFTELNDKFAASETARVRELVARTEGVEPEDFSGSTEEEMRASAKRFKARIDAEVEKRGVVAAPVAPAAAPAGTVTAAAPIAGEPAITSQDELNKMTRSERIAAHKAGRLDDLAAGRTP